ncbi:hypothetical protein [Serratia quinivorans]|uniref:hypothetical protein n=1 Tax=Serratia quinivorans TaxID=137545 RepID=UPI0021773BF4|nr:hypothetical protein [Serratia quinivorans]CAI0969371.1 Uncharacterised protein [Serratia quinivorans]CAI1711945.1 Uncharacterised protein [Serratia quinivorans]
MTKTKTNIVTIKNNARENLYLQYWNSITDEYQNILPQQESKYDFKDKFSWSITPRHPINGEEAEVLGLMNGDILKFSSSEYSVGLGCASFQHKVGMPERYKVKWEISSDGESVGELEFTRATPTAGGENRRLDVKPDLSKALHVIVTFSDN